MCIGGARGTDPPFPLFGTSKKKFFFPFQPRKKKLGV